MRTACQDANGAPVWPRASLGGKLARNVQHRRSDRVAPARRDPNELRAPDLCPVRGTSGRRTVPRLPGGTHPDAQPPLRVVHAAPRRGAHPAPTVPPVWLNPPERRELMLSLSQPVVAK